MYIFLSLLYKSKLRQIYTEGINTLRLCPFVPNEIVRVLVNIRLYPKKRKNKECIYPWVYHYQNYNIIKKIEVTKKIPFTNIRFIVLISRFNFEKNSINFISGKGPTNWPDTYIPHFIDVYIYNICIVY